MAADSHICTHCGYEGRPVRPPNDDGPSDQEASKAISRVANLILPGMGMIIRPLALFLTLPLRILFWALKRAAYGPKHCPNCGLPLMVKKSSDAGYVALRKQELKEGKRFDRPEAPKLAFGKEIALPGDEEKNAKPTPAPLPEKLPSLEHLLQDAPEPTAPMREEAPEQQQQPKKLVDPDQW